MKIIVAAAVLVMESTLCILESITKDRALQGLIEKLMLLGLLLCCCFNLVLFKAGTSGFEIDGGLFTIAMAAAIYMLMIMHRSKYIHKPRKNMNFMVCFLTIINLYVLSEPLFIYIYSPEAYSTYLFTYLNLEMMLFLFMLLKGLNYDIKTIVKVIAWFSLINAILALMQGITGKPLINFNDSTQQLTRLSIGTRVSGFITGDNGGGNLGVILFPVLLYNLKKNKSLMSIIFVFADAVFVVFTFTRIAYMAMILELLILAVSFYKPLSNRETFRFFFKIALAACASIYLYLNYFSQAVYLFFIQRGDTQAERFIQFPKALKAFASTPLLGTGHGQYNQYILYKLGLYDDLVIHSQLLNILVEEGAIIFTIFMAFNIYLIYLLVKKYRKMEEAVFIIMLVIGNLVCINFNPNQTYEINIYLYYFIMFGFLYAGKEDVLDKNNSKKNLL